MPLKEQRHYGSTLLGLLVITAVGWVALMDSFCIFGPAAIYYIRSDQESGVQSMERTKWTKQSIRNWIYNLSLIWYRVLFCSVKNLTCVYHLI